ncbi:MAG: hypothetical protein WC915_03200 [archaeon]|jgi:hypothetical protein
MVFGFLKKGKIDLKLDKLNFVEGETINGSFSLELKNPVTARSLQVILFSQKTTRDHDGDSKTVRLYEFVLPVMGEQEYGTQPYNQNFQLVIPKQNKTQVNGAVGNVLGALSSLGKMMSPITWFIEVKLDIPKGLDVGKKQQITVSDAPTQPQTPKTPAQGF